MPLASPPRMMFSRPVSVAVEAEPGHEQVETTSHDHPALLGREDAADHAAERRLAGAVASDHRQHRASRHLERHVAQSGDELVARCLAPEQPACIGEEVVRRRRGSGTTPTARRPRSTAAGCPGGAPEAATWPRSRPVPGSLAARRAWRHSAPSRNGCGAPASSACSAARTSSAIVGVHREHSLLGHTPVGQALRHAARDDQGRQVGIPDRDVQLVQDPRRLANAQLQLAGGLGIGEVLALQRGASRRTRSVTAWPRPPPRRCS